MENLRFCQGGVGTPTSSDPGLFSSCIQWPSQEYDGVAQKKAATITGTFVQTPGMLAGRLAHWRDSNQMTTSLLFNCKENIVQKMGFPKEILPKKPVLVQC